MMIEKVKDKMEFKKGLIFDYLDKCYYIQDILKNNGKDYIVTIDYNKPKEVAVFEYKYLGNTFMVSMVKEEQIIRQILLNSLKKEVA